MSKLKPARWASAWAGIREGLGVSGDIGGTLALAVFILPLLAAVGAFIVGSWPITLALLLAVSLSLNGFLAYRLLQAGRRTARVRVAVETALGPPAQRERNKTIIEPAPSAHAVNSPPIPRRWLSDPADAGALSHVTEAELDNALMRVEAVARDVLGEDAVAVFGGFYASVVPSGYGSFLFLGHSRIGEKSARFLVPGPDSPAVVFEMSRMAESPIGNHPARPWNLDPGWKELVRRVWAKERPFTGDLWLSYDENEWEVRIAPVRGGISDPKKTYRLRGADLVESAG